MKKLKFLFLSLFAALLLLSCSDSDNKALNSENLILSFTLNGVKATIDQEASLITATLPYDVDLKALTPVLEISDKAKANPRNGSVIDFRGEVKYYVVSEDRTEREYNVRISLTQSPIAQIYQFWVNDISGKINQEKKTIDVELPPHLEKESLVGRADFESVLSPSLSTVRYYTELMNFTVTAANGVTTAVYTLTIDYEIFVTQITELTDIEFVAGQKRKIFYAKGNFASRMKSTNVELWDVDKEIAHPIKTFFFKDGDANYCKMLEIIIPDAIPSGIYDLRVSCYNSEVAKATQRIIIP